MTADPVVIRHDITRHLAKMKVEMDRDKRLEIKRMLKEAQGELLRVTAMVEPPDSD